MLTLKAILSARARKVKINIHIFQHGLAESMPIPFIVSNTPLRHDPKENKVINHFAFYFSKYDNFGRWVAASK